MKKMYLALIMIVASCTHMQAQLSDNAAKLQYQQAEEAYNSARYFTAANIAADLAVNMKNWTPKVLYLHLKSIYKNYTEPSPGDTLFTKSYENFKLFAEKCEQFFTITNKTTYPQDKYNDIISIQLYFQQMQTKFAYQTTRTPAKALAFLNDCIKKFSKVQEISNELASLLENNFKPYLSVSESNIYLRLDSPFLRLIDYRKYVQKGKKTIDKIEYTVDLIDLSKTIGLTQTGELYGQSMYANNKKTNAFYRTKKGTAYAYPQPEVESRLNIRRGDNLKADTAGVVSFSSFNYPTSDFNIFNYITNTSQEFKEGGYEDRIKEAFLYLIAYFPKAKEEEQADDKRINGF